MISLQSSSTDSNESRRSAPIFTYSRRPTCARCCLGRRLYDEGALVARHRPRSCLLPARSKSAGRRADQGNGRMAFRRGIADDQPSGSARCTQQEPCMFDFELHWCERCSSCRHLTTSAATSRVGFAACREQTKSCPRYQFQRFAPICDVVHRPPPAGWDCGATVRLSPAPASLHPRCVHDCGDDLGRDRVREDGLAPGAPRARPARSSGRRAASQRQP